MFDIIALLAYKKIDGQDPSFIFMHTNPQFRYQALLYKALGNERRIWMLLFIARKQRIASDIVDALQIRPPAVTKHLQSLLRCDLITGKRIGKEVYFAVAPGVNVGAVLNPEKHLTKRLTTKTFQK